MFLDHPIAFFARGVLGVALLLLFAWYLSSDRTAIRWRIVFGGLLLQILIAACAFWVPGFQALMGALAALFTKLLSFSFDGIGLLFGDLADESKNGVVAAFKIGGTIIFFSALSALLYYLRILQWVVFGIAWVMHRAMRLSGPECLAAAANIFVGQTEAPLLIKPYLEKLTRSELMALMTGGMATIAGGVLAAYVFILGGTDEAAQQQVAKLLLTASIMSAPAALIMAKLLVPETESPNQELLVPRESVGSNVFDAITQGASDGMKLTLNVFAMIVAFFGLIMMLNWILGAVGGSLGAHQLISGLSGGTYDTFTIESVAAFLFAPVAFIIGIGTGDILVCGELLGTKFFFNDLLAFLRLGSLEEPNQLSPRSVFMITFALCGFSNFGSIGIQIAGISSLAPKLRPELCRLGFRSMVAGTLATLMTATIAGLFYKV